jgi:hypothetical protein
MIASLSDIYRSLAVSAALVLSGFDPETDFDEYASLPRTHKRPYVSYRGQDFPLSFGPYGTSVKPGVCIEFGKATSYQERYEQTVIVSVYRKVVKTWEYEQVLLDEMVSLLTPWMTHTRCSPVYSFDAEDVISTVVGNCYWAQQGLPPVMETPVGTPTSAYIGYEFQFLMRFAKNYMVPSVSPEAPPILTDDGEILTG